MSDALSEIVDRDVPRETQQKLVQYVRLLIDANARQNLISASTVPSIWTRHILDSAQLVRFSRVGSWADIGSGAGLPGIVTAILTGEPTALVEPRRLRADFLKSVCAQLDLPKVTVIRGKPSALNGNFRTIIARAVAPATDLLRMTFHLSRHGTIWLLPKGRNAQKELDEVRATWQGDFRLEPSRTDGQSSILIAQRVRPWGKQ